MKKIVSLLLAGSLVLGSGTMPAYAVLPSGLMEAENQDAGSVIQASETVGEEEQVVPAEETDIAPVPDATPQPEESDPVMTDQEDKAENSIQPGNISDSSVENSTEEVTEAEDTVILPAQAAVSGKLEVKVSAKGIAEIKASGFSIPSDVKAVQVAVWSKPDSQDDLKWYTLKKSNGVYQTKVDLYQHGTVNTLFYFHLYYQTSANKMVFLGKEDVDAEPIINTRVDLEQGTSGYTLTLTGLTVTPAKVEFAIWSAENGQDDLKWYTATYKADEKKASLEWVGDALKHTGSVYIHCYVTDLKGKKVFQGKKDLTISKDTEKRIEIRRNSDGSCDLCAVNYTELEAQKNIRVAFWSAVNGQDDLKWYPLKKSIEIREGKQLTVWSVRVVLRNHGGEDGSYYAHFYYDNSAGKPVFIGNDTLILGGDKEPEKDPEEQPGKDPEEQEGEKEPEKEPDPGQEEEEKTEPVIITEKTDKGYRLTLKNPSVETSKVQFAIWSDEGGQDDLKWYTAAYDSKTRNAILDWTGDALKHAGKVTIHCYATNSEGKQIYQGKASVEVEAPAADLIKAAFNRKTGKFTLTFTSVVNNPQKVKAAVWNDAKQADLKWYSMVKNADGTWTYTGSIKDHGNRTGTYQVHIYITDAAGKQTFSTNTRFEADTAGTLEIKPLKENVQYQAIVSGLPTSGIKQVQVAVWSAENGQDDLKWYPATKQGSNYVVTVSIPDHGSTGLYYAHAYVTNTDGVQYSNNPLKKTFQVEEKVYTDYSYLNRIADNGTFVVNAVVDSYCAASAVTFFVRTGADTSAEQLNAVRQADGSWAAVVNTGHHGYSSDAYTISCSVKLSSGKEYAGQEAVYVPESVPVFYTVVNSEASATGVIRGYSEASSATVYVWSLNGGQDDLYSYQAVKTESGWTCEFLKKNHGSAGIYRADLYVDQVFVAADQFSFDENRLADSWYSIATAHGAGGQGTNRNETYTNCLVAMNNSYNMGYRNFEIDVLLTSDQKPVLFHTWSTNILDYYTYSTATKSGPTYAQFMSDTMYGGKYATSDFANLLDYLKQHPDVKVLLDTKYRSDSDISNLFRILVQTANSKNATSILRNQIVPYFFTVSNYTAIDNIFRFKEYHYATYAAYPKSIGAFSTDSFRSVLQFCKMNRVLSVSMWDSLATKDLIRLADSFGITVYVHTTDDPATAERMLKIGAAGIIGNKIDPVQAIGFIS